MTVAVGQCLMAAGLLSLCVAARVSPSRCYRSGQPVAAARPGGCIGYVGVSHGVQLPGEELFFAEVHLHGGPAPVRRFLPHLIDLVCSKKINPGKVFDLELPLSEAAQGYRAMDERRAIKTLLRP